MPDMKPISLDDLLGATAAAPAAAATPAADNLTPVRYFTKDGLDEVAKLLKVIRTDKTLHKQEIEDLLDDPQYAKPLAGTYAIDRTKVFATKLELCEYFTALFDNAFLETHRKDAGLWTWLALAYYAQFVKTKGGIIQKSADACWIYDPGVYRFGRRHYVAGSVYLYRDISSSGEQAMQLLLSRPVTEFGRFIDALTNVEESIRTPAFFGAAIKLYYDPMTSKHFKVSSIDQNGAGSIRQLIRVFQQYAETYDFSTGADVAHLCDMLPKQFDKFKS